MMHYMPQNWASDDTDGEERLKIQYGTSMVYPASVMTAHVSAVPNHQTGHITPLDFRANVAFFGNFGYELDVRKMTDEEKEAVKKQIKLYKEIRMLMQYGDFYRLLSPFDNNVGGDVAWITVAPDKKEAVACYYRVTGEPNAQDVRFKLKGLEPDAKYELMDDELTQWAGALKTFLGREEERSGKRIYTGRQLMEFGLHVGMDLPLNSDHESKLYRFKMVE